MIINYTIGLDTYFMPYDWKEVKVSKSMEFYELVYDTIPNTLKQKYDIHINKAYDKEALLEKLFSKVDEIDYHKQLEAFIDKLLIFWSEVPELILESTSYESKYNIFELYIEKFVIDILHFGATYETQNIRAFKHNGKLYSAPKNKQIDKIIIPLEELTLVQFCEVADMINMLTNTKTSFNLVPYIIAIMYNTNYDEQEVIDSIEDIIELPANYIFEAMALYNEFYSYCSNRFKNLFNSKPSKSKIKMDNSWNKFILDIYINAKYLIDIEEIKNSKAVHWLEVKDRETEILEYENKMQEEAIKNTKK